MKYGCASFEAQLFFFSLPFLPLPSQVTENDIVMAERLFGILAYVASSELPHYRMLSLFGESR